MKVIVFALVAMVMQWSAGTRLMIVGKSGAIVRRGADLASDVVATLPKGSYAEAAGKEQEIVDKGRTKQRLQLLSPVDGWLSSNLVAAADDERPLDRELAVAVDLAERAGEAIVAIRAAHGLDTTEKAGGQGPVTEADRRADALICEGLRREFPGDSIVSEEGANADAAAERTWYVDPLDGTKNFVLPEGDAARRDWCVLIGLVVGDVPVLGVVHRPDATATWTGVVRPDGSREAVRTVAGVAEPLPRLDATALDAGPLKFAASPPVHPRFAPLVAKFAGRDAEAVPMGSAGLKAALVADGSAHMYPSSFAGMHAWDVAAGHALCRATGADLEALDGSKIAYAKDLVLSKGVLFAAPAVDADLKTKLRAMYAAIASRPRN